MSKRVIKTDKAPGAIGPYSQAIQYGELLFLSGQLPSDPSSGAIEGDIKTQTHRVLKNMAAILEAAGAGLNDVVKTTVFLKDLNDFSAMNEVYSQYFVTSPPARSTVQVAAIPRGALIEIESIAFIKIR
ncbi:MAG TPA: RidA family protein [Dehalococcoidales bacterium]|nr:RidA family protein [Dehalococcoidales bacterium]